MYTIKVISQDRTETHRTNGVSRSHIHFKKLVKDWAAVLAKEEGTVLIEASYGLLESPSVMRRTVISNASFDVLTPVPAIGDTVSYDGLGGLVIARVLGILDNVLMVIASAGSYHLVRVGDISSVTPKAPSK